MSTTYSHRGINMLATPIIAYIHKMFAHFQKPQSYGSELETYISSKHPTTVAEVEHWTKEFDKRQTSSIWGN